MLQNSHHVSSKKAILLFILFVILFAVLGQPHAVMLFTVQGQPHAVMLPATFMLDVSLSSVLTPLSNVIKGGGMAMLVWGGVKFFIALPNHNGPDAVNGLWCVLGGAGIIGLGALVTSIAV